ncbi:MAG: RluA family pseudouridine synthase, partial [Verrucomicrobiota bacterium]
ESSGERLDVFLARTCPEVSRARLQKWIKGGAVTVDGRPGKARQPVVPGSRIQIEEPEERPKEPEPEALPLSFLYEDDDLVVIDKAPGQVVHPGAGNDRGTLVNALLHHVPSLADTGDVQRPGIVHRLDKDTSGCLVVARSEEAREGLVAQFSNRETDKHYVAVVRGRPMEETGTIETHIGRNPGNRQKMANVAETHGKFAHTDYRCGTTVERSTLVFCHLHTGRTHQIRVHLQSLGHSILGDVIYGKAAAGAPKVDRLMLHAWKLGFTHPVSGEAMAFEAPVPGAFDRWMNGR